MRDKYRIIVENLYRENKQFKVVAMTLYKEKLINFDAKKYHVKVRSRYNSAFLINLLKRNNRYYIFVIKINVINMKIVININKHYSNVENFEGFKEDRYM